MFNMQKTNAPVNKFSSWKYVLILVLVILGVIYALPNIFGESPALQITMKGGKQMPEMARSKIEKALKKENIPFKKINQSQYHDEIIFAADSQVQLKSQALLQKELGDNYIVALFLSPNTPKWLLALNALPMKSIPDRLIAITIKSNFSFNKSLENFLNFNLFERLIFRLE